MAELPKIYQGQTSVKVVLTTGINFNDYEVSTQKIAFKNTATSAEWDAEKLDDGLVEGKIYVDFSDSIFFNVKGKWVLWAKLTFSDGRVGYGTPISYYVNLPGAGE